MSLYTRGITLLYAQHTRLTRWPLWNRYNRVARGQTRPDFYLAHYCRRRRCRCFWLASVYTTRLNVLHGNGTESGMNARAIAYTRSRCPLLDCRAAYRYRIIIIMLSIQRSIVFGGPTSLFFIIRPIRSDPNRSLYTDRINIGCASDSRDEVYDTTKDDLMFGLWRVKIITFYVKITFSIMKPVHNWLDAIIFLLVFNVRPNALDRAYGNIVLWHRHWLLNFNSKNKTALAMWRIIKSTYWTNVKL